MNKLQLKTPILVLISIILVINVSCASFTPLKTSLITEGVYSIKDGMVNMYLIKTGDDYIAIDAGNNSNVIVKELKKLNIDPAKIIAVLLTHVDVDHIASLNLFSNAKIYIGKGEENILNGKTKRFTFKKIDREYSLIDDFYTIEINKIQITTIPAPGHTPGSTCYFINGGLFTGDTLSLKKGRVDVFFPFFNIDTEAQKKSIDKIKRLEGIGYIFTGHSGYSNDFEYAFEKWGM